MDITYYYLRKKTWFDDLNPFYFFFHCLISIKDVMLSNALEQFVDNK